MPELVAVGEPIIDFETVEVNGEQLYRPNPGGGAANVLAAAAAQGGRTGILGCVGDDLFGDQLAATLDSLSIDTRGLKRNPRKNTGIGFVRLDKGGERSFLFYRDQASPVEYFHPDRDGPWLRGTQVLHFTSVSLAGEPGRRSTLEAVRFAREQGVAISFDLNYRPTMWTSAGEARQCLLEGLELADIVKMDRDEGEFVTGLQDPAAAGAKIRTMGAGLVCVTLGAEGCVCAAAAGEARCAAHSVDAVDTTGCGDAFTGVLLHGLIASGKLSHLDRLSPGEIAHLLARANAAGSLCALRKGSMGCMPTSAEIDAALACWVRG